MDAVLILMRVNMLTSCILIPILGLIHLELIEKSLKTTIPVTAKIITAYSKCLCSQKNVTLDLSKARYITVEVDSKCYTIRVRERLSKDQKEVLVYTDGDYAIMYSEKKRYISPEDECGLFILGKSRKVLACVSIIIIALACGELCYNKYSEDLEILQNIYNQKAETCKEMIMSKDSPDEYTVLLLMFPEMLSINHKSVFRCLLDIQSLDFRPVNNTDALADNRVELSHPVWNHVMKNHYAQLDSGTLDYESSYEKFFLINGGIYLISLFVLATLSVLYLIYVCIWIIYRKIH